MKYQVAIETVDEQPIAASRQRTTFDRIAREIGNLLGHSWAFLKERSELRRDGHNVAIYWDERDQGSIEVGVQVVARFEATDRVVCSATPGGRVARTAHFGPYSELILAHRAVREWCRENGHELVLPFWEVYGDWDDDPAKVRTDVYYLLKQGPAGTTVPPSRW
ncbi:MAG TPA: GyrI-like domain-containing protein [Bryobacteraceae bacterium]|nr:GyrI-like domain-containing protein [Bryobacteraceae bacterium]